MGFDQDDGRPIINVHKRTTKVNLWLAAAVVIFLLAGGVMIWVFTHQTPGS